MGDLENYEVEALLKQLKVLWTYHSNAIEGNTLSKGDTSFIIENGLTVQGKSIAEHNQVLGHVKAIDLIYEILNNGLLSEENLFVLHKAIQTEIVIDSEKPNGAYKAVPNGRWIEQDGKDVHHYYPAPDTMQHLMGLWFKSYGDFSIAIGSKKEAVERYTQMHVSFTSIHPFWDGNGRLARLISNLPLLYNQYLPIIISTERRREYIALLTTYNMTSKPLDKETTELVEQNKAYEALLKFIEEEYSHTERLLTALAESKKALEGK